MRSPIRQPRRPNLATIVGSGLAIVAAASLLAFSTLAEQAGLEGLATRGLQPATPSHGRGPRVIRVPAPPVEPAGAPDVVEAITRTPREHVAEVPEPVPFEVDRPAPSGLRERKRKPTKPQRPERDREDEPLVLARKAAPEPEPDADAPEYPAAAEKAKKPKKPKKPHPHKGPKKQSRDPEAPVYARTAGDGGDAPEGKSPTLKKAPAPKGKGKAEPAGKGRGKGRGKPEAAGDAKGRGKPEAATKGKGHQQHDHAGKGKGHSKHGG